MRHSFGQGVCVSLNLGRDFLENPTVRSFSTEHDCVIALERSKKKNEEEVVKVTLTSDNFTSCTPMLFFNPAFSKVVLCHHHLEDGLSELIAANIQKEDYGFLLNRNHYYNPDQFGNDRTHLASTYREDKSCPSLDKAFSIRVELTLNPEGNLQTIAFTAFQHHDHFEIIFDIAELRANPKQAFQTYVNSKIKRYQKDPTPEKELTALRTILHTFDKQIPHYLDDCWSNKQKIKLEDQTGSDLRISLHELLRKILRLELQRLTFFNASAKNTVIAALSELGVSADWVKTILYTKIKPNLAAQYSGYSPYQLAQDLMTEIARIETEKEASASAPAAAR